jgi:hypothetical protein
MKLLQLVALLLLANTVSAQDCKNVKKTEASGMTEYESPYSETNQPPIRVKRSITVVDDEKFDNFVMIFRCICPVDNIYENTAEGGKSEKPEKKLTIIFDDNSRITDDTVDVMHDITPDRTEAIRYVYYPIITETTNDFSSKKIAKFIIAGQEIIVPTETSAPLMQYTKCISAAK